MTHRFQSLALLLAPLVACGGQALDVGSNSDGSGAASGSGGSGAANGAGNMSTGATAGQEQEPSDPGVGANGNVSYAGSSGGPMCGKVPTPGPALPEWPAREDCQEGSSPLQGTWSGYVQGPGAGGYPDDGKFVVKLQGDDVALCGSIVFGQPKELAPASDPTEAYPPDADLGLGIPVLDGYSYQLAAPSLDGQRLRFDILIAEPMRSWCQLQTPYVDGVSGVEWNCKRGLGSGRTNDPVVCLEVDPCTGEELPVSCAQIDICGNPSRPCACNETGCDGNTEATVYHSFDLRFEGDEATGQVNESVVYLTRE